MVRSVLDDERKWKKGKGEETEASPQSPLVFFPRQIFPYAVLEQAIQLTASTPEMSTGYLDFSV